uniref:Aminotransferase class I/classII domain-containing protein n=1 Tax=Panagrolaimus sp. PS1159 TaxID=55785 RepID=A0AC35GHG0_9BILA
MEQKFRLSIDEINQKLSSNTKLLSITVPHNPTGTVIPQSDLDEIIKITQKSNVNLLVDETYRDMTFADKLPVAASLSPHVISVSSLSKTFGLPGIRVGWLICKDKDLMKKFLAAKEQMIICGSIVDEEIAYQFMKIRTKKLPEILKEIQIRFEIVKTWMKESSDILEWIEPKGGVVCFPRIKAKIDFDEFYQILNTKFKTFVGPGHWFEMEKSFMRIGFGWPKSHEELRQGLKNISSAIHFCLEKQH